MRHEESAPNIHLHPRFKLGLRLCDDPRTIPLERVMDVTKLPPAPFSIDHTRGMPGDFGSYLNFVLGDCGVATECHVTKINEFVRSGRLIDFDNGAVVGMYESTGGYKTDDPLHPKSNETDQGSSMEGNANYMRQVGLRDTSGQNHMWFGWCQANVVDQEQMKSISLEFGALPLAVSLPLSAQKGGPNVVWDITDENDPRQKPGSWGPHSLTLAGFDQLGPKFVTWGGIQLATWRWLSVCGHKLIVPIDPAVVNNIHGFSLDDMREALATVV